MKIDPNNLAKWFQPIDVIFTKFGEYVLDYHSLTQRRIFIDNNSPILFIAHLDTVQEPKLHRIADKKIYAAGLDDRLGCYIANRMARKLKTDLLLTDNEESGASTAYYHNCKDYNWIVEFDRAGGDVVTYDMDNPEFRDALQTQWIINDGLFSDISFLKTTACCMNLGIGYEHAHSKDSYAKLDVLSKQIRRFMKFYNDYKDTKFTCDRQTYEHDLICDICGFVKYDCEFVHGSYVCGDCFEDMLYHFTSTTTTRNYELDY